jgi:DNA-binding transcriptional LysR family regulator
MDLKQLRYFVAVASERNFRRAAERLNMAQPPLSRRIQELELELGAPLIDRSARPIELTDAGRLVYEQAILLLERADELRSMVDRIVAAKRRRFVIGFVPSVMYAGLPHFIREFRCAAPHVDINLVELISIEQIGALKDGRIDAGFGRIRLDDPAIRRTILHEERLGVAMPPAHPLSAQKGPISLKEIANERLILYPRHPRPSFADQVIALFRGHGLDLSIAHEAPELQTALGLVTAEEGIAVVPGSIERLRPDDITYRMLAEADAVSPVIMSSRQDDHSPELTMFSAVIRKTYEQWGQASDHMVI